MQDPVTLTELYSGAKAKVRMAHWKGGWAATGGEWDLLYGLTCRASACEVRGGQSGTGTGFSPLSVFPCQDNSTIASYSRFSYYESH
jgi:hypothetical protein